MTFGFSTPLRVHQSRTALAGIGRCPTTEQHHRRQRSAGRRQSPPASATFAELGLFGKHRWQIQRAEVVDPIYVSSPIGTQSHVIRLDSDLSAV